MKTAFRKFLKVFAPLMLVVFAIACFAGGKLFNSNLTPVQAEQLVETQTSETDEVESSGNLGLEKWEDYAQEQVDSGIVPSSFTPKTNSITINGTAVATRYEIDSAESLAYFAKQVNTGNNKSSTIVLMADIDLSGKIWTPIGYDSSHYFTGTFYGNGHTIKGITIDSTINVDSKAKALFGYCSGTIRDLIVENSTGCYKDIVGVGSANLYGCSGSSSGTITNPANYEEKNSAGTVQKSGAMGVNNFFYQVTLKYPVYDDNGNVTDWITKELKALINGKKYKGFATSNFTIDFSDIYDKYESDDFVGENVFVDGSKEYLNITNILVQEYNYYSGTFFDTNINYNNEQTEKYTDPCYKVEFRLNGSQSGYRSYTQNDITGSDTSKTLPITLKYAYQSYIKIELTLDYKYVSKTSSEADLFNFYNIDQKQLTCSKFGNDKNVRYNATGDIYSLYSDAVKTQQNLQTQYFKKVNIRTSTSEIYAQDTTGTVDYTKYDIGLVSNYSFTKENSTERFYKYNSNITYKFKNQNGILKLAKLNKAGSENAYTYAGSPASTSESTLTDVIRADSSGNGTYLYAYNIYGVKVNNSEYVKIGDDGKLKCGYYTVNETTNAPVNATVIVHSNRHYTAESSSIPRYIYLNYSYKDAHMFGVCVQEYKQSGSFDSAYIYDSSYTSYGVDTNSSSYKNTNNDAANYSNLSKDGMSVYARWYMLKTTYDYEFINETSDNTQEIKFIAYKPYLGIYREITSITSGKIDLYYTEKLYIYDTKTQPASATSKFYYSLKGVNDEILEFDETSEEYQKYYYKKNEIRQSRDFIYEVNEDKTKNKSNAWGHANVKTATDDSSSEKLLNVALNTSGKEFALFYGAIEVSALMETGVKLTVTKKDKTIDDVYFRVLNGKNQALTQAQIKSELGFDLLSYANQKDANKSDTETKNIAPNSKFTSSATEFLFTAKGSTGRNSFGQVEFSGVKVNALQTISFTKNASSSNNMYITTVRFYEDSARTKQIKEIYRNKLNLIDYNKKIEYYFTEIKETGGEVYIDLIFTSKDNSYDIEIVDLDYLNNPFNQDEIKINDGSYTKATGYKKTNNDKTNTFTIKAKYLKYYSFEVYTYDYNYNDDGSINITTDKINIWTTTSKALTTTYTYSSTNTKFTLNYNAVSTLLGDETLKITIDNSAYFPGGLYIVVNYKEIVYDYNLEIENGVSDKLVQSKDPYLVNFTYRYTDFIFITSDNADDFKYSIITINYPTDTAYLTKTSFTVTPINANYVLDNTKTTVSPQRITGKNLINSIKQTTQKIVYIPRVYDVTVIPYSYYNSEYQNLQDLGLMQEIKTSTNAGNLTKDKCIISSKFFKFSHFDIKNLNDGTWESVTLQDDYLIKIFVSIINGESVTLTPNGKYSKTGIVFRAVYEPVEYELVFRSDKTVSKRDGVVYGTDAGKTTVTKVVTYLETQTLLGLLNVDEAGVCDLYAPGYVVENFIVNKGSSKNTYTNGQTVREFLDVEANAESTAKQTIKIDLDYKGLQVTFNFIVKDNNVLYPDYNTSANGVFGDEFDFSDILKNLSSTISPRVIRKVSVGGNVSDYDANKKYVFTSDLYDYTKGTLTYEIPVIISNAEIAVRFSDTYLKTSDTKVTKVLYNSNNYEAVPVPTRQGFTFAYWKATTAKKDYFIYLNGGTIDKTRTTICDYDGNDSLYFIAYWEIDNALIQQITSKFTKVYDSENSTIQVASFTNYNGLLSLEKSVKAYLSTDNGKTYSELSKLTTNNNVILLNAKYVTDNGIYKFVYSYNFVSSSGVASKDYIINKDILTDIEVKCEIEITPKTLGIENGKITKVYDGTKTVLQNITGICENDKDIIIAYATYKDENVGENIEIEYYKQASGENATDILSSYNIPTEKTGTITQLNINVTLNDNAYSVYRHSQKNKNFTVADLTVDKTGYKNTSANNYIYNVEYGVINSENYNAWNKLKENVTLTFKVVTSSGEIGSYYADNGTLNVTDLKINDDTVGVDNYKINVLKTFEIKDLGENQKGFIFTAQKEDTKEFVEPILIGNDYFDKYYEDNQLTIRRGNCVVGRTQTFGLKFENLSKYWIKEVKISDKNNNFISNATFTYDMANLCYNINIDITNNDWYLVDIVFTNKTEITLDYVLAKNEKINGVNRQTLTIDNGATVNFGTLTRDAFTFKGWTTTLNDSSTIFTGNVWTEQVGKIVLYALWEYTPSAPLTGTDINKVYDGKTTEVEPIFTKANSNISTQVIWLKSTDKTVWTNVDSNLVLNDKLKVRTVANSGYYAYTLNVTANIVYLNELGEEVEEEVLYHSENMISPYQQFNVVITKKDITLENNIDKVYDATKYLTYTLTANDLVSSGVCEGDDLVGSKLEIAYSDTIVGSAIDSISSIEEIINNYNILANGNIVKRNITLKIGDVSFAYTGLTAKAQVKTLIDYNNSSITPSYAGENSLVLNSLTIPNVDFTIKSLFIETTNYSVGKYENKTVNAVLSIVDSKGLTVSLNNFVITIEGSITITRLTLKDSDVIVDANKTYNGQNQTILEGDITIAPTNIKFEGDQITFKVTDENGNDFDGAKDVGIYNVKVVIESLNYEPFTKDVILNIKSLYVKLTQKTAYEREYNGTKSTNLEKNTHYSYEFKDGNDKSVQILDENALFEEINENYTFVFEDKNVGVKIPINFELVNTEYKNIVLVYTKAFTGNITKVKAKLNVGNISKKYITDMGDSYKVDAENISIYNNDGTKSTIGETISSGQLLIKNQYKVGSFDLIALELGKVDYSKLIVSDGENITKNYEIIGILGNLTVTKAIISIEMLGEQAEGDLMQYIYSGKMVALKYKATITTDDNVYTISSTDERIANYVRAFFNAINVGNYNAQFVATDTDIYEIENSSKELPFEIVKKDVFVTVDATKTFDTKTFAYTIVSSNIRGLNAGHYFDANAKIITTSSNCDEYKVDSERDVRYENIVIYDDKASDVTSNYNITYSGQLTIVASIATIDEFDEYSYVGNEQTLTINISLNNGTKQTLTYSKAQALDEQNWLRNNSGKTVLDYLQEKNLSEIVILSQIIDGTQTIDTNGQSFLYAGTYNVSIYSINYTCEDAEVVISPKVIDVKNLKGYSLNKPYDQKLTVLGEITSDDIYTQENGGIIDDNIFVDITGEYSNLYGENNEIKFTLVKKENLDEQLANLVFGSYTLSNDKIYGAITKKDIVFNYVGQEDVYYTGQGIKLDFTTNFEITNLDGSKNTSVMFTGYLIFSGIINAGSYDLSTVQFASVLNENFVDSSQLNYYNITFKNTLVVKKAVVNVYMVDENIYTYNAQGQKVKLTASIVDSKGEILSGNETSILTAKYAKSGTNTFVSEGINAGEYDIYPEIAEEYKNNYEYLGGMLTDEKLIINARKFTVKVEQSIYYLKLTGRTYWQINLDNSYIESGDVNSGIITGHIFTATARTSGTDVKSYIYPNDVIVENVMVSDVAGNDLLANYNITYSIKLTVSNDIKDAGLYISAKELTYNSKDQKSLDIFEVKSTDSETEITLLSATYYTNESCTITTGELKNVGTYYALVKYKDNATNTTFDYPFIIKITIKEFTINTYKLKDGTEFTGNKVYDAKNYVELGLDGIFEDDKAYIDSMLATYLNGSSLKVADASDTVLNVSISLKPKQGYEYLANNYILTPLTGKISARELTLSLNKDVTTELLYVGENAISLTVNNFDITDGSLVDGENISSLLLENTLTSAGDYYVKDFSVTLKPTIKNATNNDVTSNYKIIFNQEDKFVVKPLPITLAYKLGNLVYNSENRAEQIKQALNYAFELPSYAKLSRDELLLEIKDAFEILFNKNAEVKNAGEYSITIVSNSANFDIKVDEANSTLTITPADIVVDFTGTEITYTEYRVNDGYKVQLSNISGLTETMFENDSAYFGAFKFKVKQNPPYANTLYTYNADAENSQIEAIYDKNDNNYNVTIKAGSLTLTATALDFTINKLVYTGLDLFNDLVITYDLEGTEMPVNKIEKIELVDAGVYLVIVTVNDAIYDVAVEVEKRQITLAELDFESEKTYDGSKDVLNADGNSTLKTFENDGVQVTARYVDEFKVNEDNTINFYITDPNGKNKTKNYYLPESIIGRIVPKEVTIDFGDLKFIYDKSNAYSYNYGETASWLVTGDAITPNTKVFTFKVTGVCENVDVNTYEITDIFDISRDGRALRNNYRFIYQGTITVSPIKFEVKFDKFADDKTEFNNASQGVTYTIVASEGNETQYEANKAEIESSLLLTYNDKATLPFNVGVYEAKVSCTSKCFEIVNENTYTYEIVKFVYDLDLSEVVSDTLNAEKTKLYFTKFYGEANPEFKVEVEHSFALDNSLRFSIELARVDEEETDDKYYDLKFVSCSNDNIDVRINSEYLTGAFYIQSLPNDDLIVLINGKKDSLDLVYRGSDYVLDLDIKFTVLKNKTNIEIASKEVVFKGTTNVFTKIKDAGTYVITYTVKAVGYEEIEATSDFTITISKYNVVIVPSVEIVKDYDATNKVNDFDYDLKDALLKVDAKTEVTDLIKELGDLEFTYADINAGEWAINLTAKEYKNLNVTLKENTLGIINKINTVLVVSGQKVYDGNVIKTRPIIKNAINMEELSADITINIKTAGVYQEEAFNANGYDLNMAENSVLANYNITKLTGSFTILKAILKLVSFKEEYEYTGNLVVLEYTFELQQDLENYDSLLDVSKYIRVDNKNAIKYGTYTAEFTLLDSDNYQFEDGQNKLSKEFKITKTQLTITVNDSKPYDTTALVYNVKTEDVSGSLVLTHTFIATITTNKAIKGVYNVANKDDVTITYKIVGENDIDVTDNYYVVFEGSLEITSISASDIQMTFDSYTYLGKKQQLTANVVINGYTIVVDTNSTKELYLQLTKFNGIEKENINFNYAGSYGVNLVSKSESFETKTDTVVMQKQVIDNVTGYNTDKQYDGNKAVLGNLKSTSIYADDLLMVTLVGTYSDVFGNNLQMQFTLNAKPSTNEETAKLIIESYQFNLAETLGNITKRKVIFTYSSDEKLFYTGTSKALSFDKFTCTNLLDSEEFSGSVMFDNALINAGEYSLEEIANTYAIA